MQWPKRKEQYPVPYLCRVPYPAGSKMSTWRSYAEDRWDRPSPPVPMPQSGSTAVVHDSTLSQYSRVKQTFFLDSYPTGYSSYSRKKLERAWNALIRNERTLVWYFINSYLRSGLNLSCSIRRFSDYTLSVDAGIDPRLFQHVPYTMLHVYLFIQKLLFWWDYRNCFASGSISALIRTHLLRCIWAIPAGEPTPKLYEKKILAVDETSFLDV